MEKKTNKLKFVLGIVLVGVLKAIIDEYFDVIMKHTWIVAIVILLIAIAIVRAFYFDICESKIKKAKELLSTGKYDEFIRQAQELLKKVKVKGLKTTLKIDIASAYIYKEDYDSALNLLSDIKVAELSTDDLQVTCALNLFTVYYLKEEYSLAKAVYEKFENVIEQYSENENIAEMQIQYYIIVNDLDKAYEISQKAISDTEDKDWKNRFKRYENFIGRQEDKNNAGVSYALKYKWAEKEELERQEQKDISNEPVKNVISVAAYVLLLMNAFLPIAKIVLPNYGYQINLANNNIYLVWMDLIFVFILSLIYLKEVRLDMGTTVLISMLIVPLSVINSAFFIITAKEVVTYIFVIILCALGTIFELKYMKQIQEAKGENKGLRVLSLVLAFIGFTMVIYWVFGGA